MSLLNSHASTWAEVDLNAIRHNFQEIKRLAGPHTEILCVVKGDAYGHGMLEVSALLDRLGANFFGVSDLEEGIVLRKNGITKPILLFESTLPAHARQIVDYNLTPTICTIELAYSLNRYAKTRGRRIDIHIDVDTGMGRLGVWHEEAFEFIQKVNRLANLSIKGIYTHFPVADTDPRFTKNQMKHLYALVSRLDKMGVVVPYIHAANSMGLVNYTDLHPNSYSQVKVSTDYNNIFGEVSKTHLLNLVRPGLMLYGLYPSPRLKKKIRLKPALSVQSKIVFLKNVRRGRGISYGHTFIAPKDLTVATLAIGYKDGYLRCLSNRAFVLIGGQRCPIVGRVTMDQIMVDVSKLKSLKVGTTAVILGKQKGNFISADELAKYAGTISYEIVCSLGNHLPRIYKTKPSIIDLRTTNGTE